MPDKKLTDSEIVKALECHLGVDKQRCKHCKYTEYGCYCLDRLHPDLLDLINRQKAKIDSFEKRQKPTGASGYKYENGKVVFFTNMLGGCRYEYQNMFEVVKTLNELLQEAYAKDEIAFALKCKTEELETAKAENERLRNSRDRWKRLAEDFDRFSREEERDNE